MKLSLSIGSQNSFWVQIGASYDSWNLTDVCARQEANIGTEIDAIVLAVCFRQRAIAGRDKIDPYHRLSQLSTDFC